MKKPEQAFIDPAGVSPRMLTNAEMHDLSGGALPLVAVIWVTSCGSALVVTVVVVAVTVLE